MSCVSLRVFGDAVLNSDTQVYLTIKSPCFGGHEALLHLIRNTVFCFFFLFFFNTLPGMN